MEICRYPPLLLNVQDLPDKPLVLVDHDGRVDPGEERLALKLHHIDLSM